MADPLSIAASAIAVGGAGGKLAKSLYTVIESYRKAEGQLRPVADHVKLTSTVLDSVGSLLKEEDVRRLCKDSMLLATQDALRGCRDAFDELRAFVDGLLKPDSEGKTRMGSVAKMTFLTFRSRELEALQGSLERFKSSLDLVLSVLSLGLSIKRNNSDAAQLQQQKIEIERLMKARSTAEGQTSAVKLEGEQAAMSVPPQNFVVMTSRSMPDHSLALSDPAPSRASATPDEGLTMPTSIPSVAVAMHATETAQPCTQRAVPGAVEDGKARASGIAVRSFPIDDPPPLAHAATTAGAGRRGHPPSSTSNDELSKHLLRCTDAVEQLSALLEETTHRWQTHRRYARHGLTPAFREAQKAMKKLWALEAELELSEGSDSDVTEDVVHSRSSASCQGSDARFKSLSRKQQIAVGGDLSGVAALAGLPLKNRRNAETVIINEALLPSRSRSRRQRGSPDSYIYDEPSIDKEGHHRDLDYRNRKIAKAGLATAATAGVWERVCTTSRDRSKESGRFPERSKSRVRRGVPIAAEGLGGAALAGLYEKNKANKAARQEAFVQDVIRGGRSKRRSRSRGRHARRDSVPASPAATPTNPAYCPTSPSYSSPSPPPSPALRPVMGNRYIFYDRPADNDSSPVEHTLTYERPSANNTPMQSRQAGSAKECEVEPSDDSVSSGLVLEQPPRSCSVADRSRPENALAEDKPPRRSLSLAMRRSLPRPQTADKASFGDIAFAQRYSGPVLFSPSKGSRDESAPLTPTSSSIRLEATGPTDFPASQNTNKGKGAMEQPNRGAIEPEAATATALASQMSIAGQSSRGSDDENDHSGDGRYAMPPPTDRPAPDPDALQRKEAAAKVLLLVDPSEEADLGLVDGHKVRKGFKLAKIRRDDGATVVDVVLDRPSPSSVPEGFDLTAHGSNTGRDHRVNQEGCSRQAQGQQGDQRGWGLLAAGSRGRQPSTDSDRSGLARQSSDEALVAASLRGSSLPPSKSRHSRRLLVNRDIFLDRLADDDGGSVASGPEYVWDSSEGSQSLDAGSGRAASATSSEGGDPHAQREQTPDMKTEAGMRARGSPRQTTPRDRLLAQLDDSRSSSASETSTDRRRFSPATGIDTTERFTKAASPFADPLTMGIEYAVSDVSNDTELEMSAYARPATSRWKSSGKFLSGASSDEELTETAPSPLMQLAPREDSRPPVVTSNEPVLDRVSRKGARLKQTHLSDDVRASTLTKKRTPMSLAQHAESKGGLAAVDQLLRDWTYLEVSGAS